jgi:uncharacterized Tic20 family protein
MTERWSVVGDLASTFFYLLGSLIGLVLAVWTLRHEEEYIAEEQGDDDIFYNAVPYRTLSCLTATCYLLDVALDVDNHRRSNITAWWFGIGAFLELASTILNIDWIMVMAVHAYLASAVLILAKPPDGHWEGRADLLFGIGCGFDVALSYCYWNETFDDVLLYGDVLSAIDVWFRRYRRRFMQLVGPPLHQSTTNLCAPLMFDPAY